jgi:hypothetical protein
MEDEQYAFLNKVNYNELAYLIKMEDHGISYNEPVYSLEDEINVHEAFELKEILDKLIKDKMQPKTNLDLVKSFLRGNMIVHINALHEMLKTDALAYDNIGNLFEIINPINSLSEIILPFLDKFGVVKPSTTKKMKKEGIKLGHTIVGVLKKPFIKNI